MPKGLRKFPDQTRTLELCKYVISELTPHFRAAVETETVRADLALSDSGMGGLLHSLLVHNCDNGVGEYRLAQEAENLTNGWNLAQEISDAAQTQSDKKSRTSNAIRGQGRNIDKLRKG